MLNLGVRAHDFGKKKVEELAKDISGYKFTSIQLALKKAVLDIGDDTGKLSPGLGNYIRDTFGTYNINISVLGCYINPVHPDLKEREKSLARFIDHLRFSRDFGCSVVGTETGSPLPDCSFTEEIYREKTFQDFIGSLKILVKAAEKMGVIAAIEGVADKHCIFSHERMKRTLDIIPSQNLGVIYDPVNFLPSHQEKEADQLMEEAFELFSSRMVAVHAKDYIMTGGKKDGTLPAGKGKLNYPLLADLIHHYKPHIHVLLENNSLDTITESVQFMSDL